MAVGEEQKRRRINQKKRKPEESPHSNMVAVRDLDEQQISPKESGKKMKKVKSPLSNMAARPDLDEQHISPKDSRKKMKKVKSPLSNMAAHPDLDEEQISPKESEKKMKKVKSPLSNMAAHPDLDEQQISPKDSGKKLKKVKSLLSNMAAHPDLDEQQISPKDSRKKMKKKKYSEGEGSRAGENKLTQESNSLPSCIDKLREELSCPICLEICYEPTSLWCGHSFCIRCLRLTVIKFGKKCPKCQQFIRKGRPYILNTVVWNTIQLLFPREVEARMLLYASKIEIFDDDKMLFTGK